MSDRWTVLASRLNPSCRDVMGLFSRSLDRPPGRSDRIIVAIHLLHCTACRRSRRQILMLVAAFRRHSGKTSGEALPGLPRAIRERIIRTLLEE